MAYMEWGPGLPDMTRLSRIHVLNFFRDGGIWVKWKQYMTSDTWSAPVLLIPESDIPNVAKWAQSRGIRASRNHLPSWPG